MMRALSSLLIGAMRMVRRQKEKMGRLRPDEVYEMRAAAVNGASHRFLAEEYGVRSVRCNAGDQRRHPPGCAASGGEPAMGRLGPWVAALSPVSARD